MSTALERPPSGGTAPDPAAPPSPRRHLGRLARAAVFPLVAAAIAFSIGAVVIVLAGQDPIAAYAALLRGAFGSRAALGRTLLNATPLVLTGLAVALPFRAGLFNIGGEGQFFVGAIAAAGIAAFAPLADPLAVVVAIVGACLAGFAWGAIPGALKSLGAHEVITTIMLNFVGINLAYYLVQNPFDAGSVVPGTPVLEASRRVVQLGAGLGRAHWGVLLALLAALVAYLLVWRTAKGYALRAVGLAPEAARYAGIGVAGNAVLAIALGGLFAGLAGGLEVLGTYGRVTIPFVSNVGFSGIGVALLGRNSPGGVVLAAVFFGALAAGAQEMQFSAGVPLDLAEVLLAIVLLFVTATRLVELVVGRRARALSAGTKLERGLGG